MVFLLHDPFTMCLMHHPPSYPSMHTCEVSPLIRLRLFAVREQREVEGAWLGRQLANVHTNGLCIPCLRFCQVDLTDTYDVLEVKGQLVEGLGLGCTVSCRAACMTQEGLGAGLVQTQKSLGGKGRSRMLLIRNWVGRIRLHLSLAQLLLPVILLLPLSQQHAG